MYNPKLALALAQASNRAYAPTGSDLLADINSGVSRVVILPFGDNVIVAFRGTEKEALRQWLADMDACLVPFVTVTGDTCRVHQGFLDDVASLMAGIETTLASHTGRVYVTGHSKGAGEAVVFAAGRSKVAALYTYGQPRSGDAAFAAAISKQLAGAYYRVVNDRDLVPRVPDEALDYCHGGTLALFDHAGNLSSPPEMGAASIDVIEDIDEHLLPAYLDRLSKLSELVGESAPATINASAYAL